MRKNILLFVLLAAISCNGPTKPQTPLLQLTLDDASCTEAFLKLQLGTNIHDRTVTLKRDGVELWTRSIDVAEIAFTDTSLLPGHTYTYTARLLSPPPFWLGSNSTAQLQVRTLDTTSSNWVFDSQVILGNGSGTLYDVAIINDTLAYAVGEIRVNDTIYNAAKWDGEQWELKRITVNYNSNWITPPLNGVFAFSATDIWFSSGVPIHGDGNSWTQYHLFDMGVLTQSDGSINKIWGTNSSNDMYFVGNKGTIVHYSGTWTKLESGTVLNINDIWGDYNILMGQYKILCVASNIGESLDREVLKINGTSAQIISKEGIMGTLSSVWFKSDRKYYVAGGGIYEKNNLNNSSWANGQFDITTYYTAELRGNGLNDIIAAGGVGEVLHYNGVGWKSYFNETKLNYGNYNSVAIKNNLVIAVGVESPRAAILMGRR
jgi:hypothetical protein